MAVLSAIAPVARASYQARAQAPFQLAQVLSNITEEQRKEKVRKLGEEFIKQGDYTPEGIRRFAEANRLTPTEMFNIVKAVRAFNEWKEQADPLVKVTEVDPTTGAKYTKYVRRSELIKQGRILTGLPEKVVYVNRKTRERKLFSKNEVPSSADWVPEDRWKEPKKVTVIDKLTGETKTVPEDQVGGRYEPFEVYKWRKEQERKGKPNKQVLNVLRYLSGYLDKFVYPQYIDDPQALALGSGIRIAVENMRKRAAQGDPQAKRDLALHERVQKMSAMLGLGEDYFKQEEKMANDTAQALIEEVRNRINQTGEAPQREMTATSAPQEGFQGGSFTPSEQPQQGLDLSALTTNPQGWIIEQLGNMPDAAISTLSAIAQSEGIRPAGEYVEGLSRQYGQGPGVSFPLVSGLKGLWEWLKKRPENEPHYP